MRTNILEPIDNDGRFARGTGEWTGIVLIERPNQPHPESPCRVTSARTIALDGRRAIFCYLTYKTVEEYFSIFDGFDTYRYAEFKEGHLEFYERAEQRDYFLHAADHILQ